MMKKFFSLFAIAALVLLGACSTPKQNLAYFEGGMLNDTSQVIINDYLIKIQPDDELVISVTSIVPEATAPYNLLMINPALRGDLINTTQPQNQTYVVSKDGNIDFPVLGVLKVQDLTTDEISDMIKEMVEQDVDSPNVRVELVNFKVNVLGEVKNPGVISVDGQRFSVLDALAECGDLTEYGQRNNIKVIREVNGVRSYATINLDDESLFSSPYFFLQQNDVIYIKPNEIKEDNARYNTNNAYKLSFTATMVSAASVIASLAIALFL